MRKTNLFYLEGNNSNFLTFSNYGEYLTGVCLSTNNKIYPSSFICLNLPFDDNHSVKSFKEFLMCYYENKLAYMRDLYESKKEDNAIYIHQEQVMSLSYLFESIYLFFNKQKPEITYFGDIVEHDYNGTYSDSICIVDFKRYLTGELSDINYDIDFFKHELTDEFNKPLYGWDEQLEKYTYDNDENTHGDNIYYEEESIFDSLHILEGNKTNIEFNCVIPLFDINNINFSQNNKHIKDIDEDVDTSENNDNSFYISFNRNDYDVYKYIPYGIWFAPDTDNTELNKIQLYKTNDNISQSWSLVIASKFTPYPYGLKINDENISNDVTDIYTYAELLKQQAKLIKSYNNMLNEFSKLSNEIQNMKTMIKSINALDIDDVRRDTQDMISNNKAEIDKEIAKLNEKFAQFTWENIDKHQNN